VLATSIVKRDLGSSCGKVGRKAHANLSPDHLGGNSYQSSRRFLANTEWSGVKRYRKSDK